LSNNRKEVDMNQYEKYKVDVPVGESGEWKVEKFKVEEADMAFQRIRAVVNPRESSRMVPVGEYTRLTRGSGVFREVVMSDTPAEILDHLDFITEARGKVLINGLGLGVALNAVLQKPEVEQVTVVEISEDVVKLVGQHYLDKANGKLKIIVADALTWRPEKGEHFNVVWHDIWDNICSDNLESMKKLHRSYGKRCDWQGSWGKELCEDQRRRTGW
jgi:hypothetical protein